MNQNEKLLNGLKQAVLDNLENELFSVEHLAEIVGISRSHLHRRLKKITGQSISQFVREIRLAEAMKMLRQDVATTSEIAYKVGFNSPSYFHKCFLEYYGYPPSEAKNIVQNQEVNENAEDKSNNTFQNQLNAQRKLAAILFADIVGYTAMMQQDEQLALQKLNHFKEILESFAVVHLGKIIQYYGDGCLIIFNSSTQAVSFAKGVQHVFQKDPKVAVRIGIHSGDIVLKEGNVFGDAVNIASRIESLGVPGSVLLSSNVRNQIKNQTEFELHSLGRFEFKNVEGSMTVYALANDRLVVPENNVIRGKVKKTSTSTKSRKKLITLAGAFILFAVVAFFFYKKFGKESFASQANLEKSIAVLPFNSLSEDEENQHFADGLVEDLLNRLALIEDFKVISRTSSDTYRERGTKKVPEIAEELGVTYIVEGSVQKYENEVKITIQLIDAKSDDHLWFETYEKDLSDIFNIQSQIAMQVASGLSSALTDQQKTAIQKSQTENVKAFELYQLGRLHLEKRTLDGLKISITYFEQAITEDPKYVLAYTGLAETYFLLSSGIKKNKKNSEKVKALELARKALELDPRLAEAYTVLAAIYLFRDWNWAAAENAFKKAFEFNSNYPTLHQHYAEHLSMTGRHEEARKHINKAIELDPLSYVIRSVSTKLYFNRGQFEEALAEGQICEEINKENNNSTWHKFVISYILKDGPAMVEGLKQYRRFRGAYTTLHQIDSIYEASGFERLSNQVDSVYEASGLDGLLKWEIDQTDWHLGKADYYALFGDYDKALDWLEVALEDGSYMNNVPFWYSLRELHDHPRFIAIINKMNLPWTPESSE